MAYSTAGAKVEVKGSEFHISGEQVARLHPERISVYVQERIACAAANRCRPGDDLETKVKCVTTLIQNRFKRGGQRAGGTKVSARKEGQSLVLTLAGHDAKAVSPDHVQQIVKRAVECAATHGPTDDANDLWACVAFSGKNIFSR